MGGGKTTEHGKGQTMQDMAATRRQHDSLQQVLGCDAIDGGAASVEDDVAIDSDLEGLFDSEEDGEGAVPGCRAPGVEEEGSSTGVVAGAGIGGDSDTYSDSDFSLDEEGAAESGDEEAAAATAAEVEAEGAVGSDEEGTEEYELDLDDILDRLWNDSLRAADKSAIQQILRHAAEHGLSESGEGSVAGSTTSTTTATTTSTTAATEAAHESCAATGQDASRYRPAATSKTARTATSKAATKAKAGVASAAPASAATSVSSTTKLPEKQTSGQDKSRSWTDEEDRLGKDFMMSVVEGGDRSEARFEKTAAFLTSQGFDRTRYSVRNRCNRSWRGPHWDDRKPTADGTQRAFVTSARASAKQAQLAKIGVLVAEEAGEAAERPTKTKTKERKRKTADEDKAEGKDEDKDKDEDLEEGEIREPTPKRSRTSAASGISSAPLPPAPVTKGHWRPRTGKKKRVPDPIKVQQARFDGLSRLDNRSGR